MWTPLNQDTLLVDTTQDTSIGPNGVHISRFHCIEVYRWERIYTYSAGAVDARDGADEREERMPRFTLGKESPVTRSATSCCREKHHNNNYKVIKETSSGRIKSACADMHSAM